MNNSEFIPCQRLDLNGMTTSALVNLIRVAATNFQGTSLILTPRIDQNGYAYSWTSIRMHRTGFQTHV